MSNKSPMESDKPVTEPRSDRQLPDGDDVARDFYYLNFLSILGSQSTPEQISVTAGTALKNRAREKALFEKRLARMVSEFRTRAQHTGVESAVTRPALNGWTDDSVALISKLRAESNGLVVALFHLGAHRHVALDLAALGIPVSAPIAGRAYWDYYNLRTEAPADFSMCLKLLEVESRSVGRELLVDIRRGRVGAIYVDGNMGPDGHHVDEGAVTVAYFGHDIRVKAGVARIAMAACAPILPIFTTSLSSSDGRIILGAPIFPQNHAPGNARGAGSQEVMQSLYLQLQERVRLKPEDWEFGVCLHRWMEDKVVEQREEVALDAQALGRFQLDGVARINANRVAAVRRDGSLVWVDVHLQKSYKLPDWFISYARLLQTPTGLSRDHIAREMMDDSMAEKIIRVLGGMMEKNLVVVD